MAPCWRCIPLLLFTVMAVALAARQAGLTGQQIESLRAAHGDAAARRLTEWVEVIARGARLPESQKLELVNRFFNRLRFVSDRKQWGRRDYWATPIEFLTTAAGDCEDFSIAKYFTLKEMGVPVRKMRITYVKVDGRPDPAHMVLAYYPTRDADPLILDNLIAEIKTGRQRPDLHPVYSFNGEGLWKAVAQSRGRKLGPARGLTVWRDLLARMEREQTLDLEQ